MFEPENQITGRFYRGYLKRIPPEVDFVLVAAVALFIGCWGVGSGPLAGTEGHRALTAHRMASSGEWLVPFLYDQPYLRKPPLHYWVLASLEVITQQNNNKAPTPAMTWIWRIPSAIFGAVTATFLAFITTRWYGRMAGLVAGFSCVGMIALWEQNRTAEIDALNTMACVIVTCLLLDLLWSPARDRRYTAFSIGLAFAAALLTKGPAGIAPIIGAVVGPAIINRSTAELKKPWPWVGLMMGILLFCIYGVAAWVRSQELSIPPDTSGLHEAIDNIFSDRVKNILPSLALPFVLFVFALPASMSLILSFHPIIWSKSLFDPRHSPPEWSEVDCLMLRSLVGTLLVSLAITLLFGMVKPRYSYVWLPMVCPVAGAVAASLQRGIFADGKIWQVKVDRLVAWSAVLYTAATIVLVVMCVSKQIPAQADAGISQGLIDRITYALHSMPAAWKLTPGKIVLVGSALCAILVCLITQRAIKRNNTVLTAWGFLLLILLASLPFFPWSIMDRAKRSTFNAAVVLKEKLPEGTFVTTGQLVMDQPELFYYANVGVESHPYQFNHAMNLQRDRWIVLNGDEYNAWNHEAPDRLSDAENIDPAGPAVWLARYIANPIAATQPAQSVTASTSDAGAGH